MTVIDESRTAKGFTPAASVPQVFGRARTLDGIVIHHWGLPGQTHDGVVDFFCSTGPGATSAHFVVSAGRISCIVSPLDAAWHSGNAVGNATTIGIECRPEATDADYATVAELVRWLRDEYGDLPLSPHRQWQSTACPGVWDLARIDRLAATAAITPQSTNTPKEDTLSAAEVADIKKHQTAQADRVIDYVGKLLVFGYSDGKQDLPGGNRVDIVNQNLLKTIIKLLERPDLSAEQITEAVKAGLADDFDMDATFTFKKKAV